jgi:hypothetical protein
MTNRREKLGSRAGRRRQCCGVARRRVHSGPEILLESPVTRIELDHSHPASLMPAPSKMGFLLPHHHFVPADEIRGLAEQLHV